MISKGFYKNMTGSNFNSKINLEKHTVHWFRKGLRLHDNPAIHEGLAGSKTLRCVFLIDPWFAGISNAGINKWRYFCRFIYLFYRQKCMICLSVFMHLTTFDHYLC